MEDVRQRIFDSSAMPEPSGVKASGRQLADRLERLLLELGQGVASDPVSAAEHAVRSLHLDPLVEDIAKKFTLAASRGQGLSSPTRYRARELGEAPSVVSHVII